MAPKKQKDNANKKPAPASPADGEPYKVGPGRPPKEHRFKPGQSGNPKGGKRKGRPLGPDLRELFEKALNEKVTVTEGERKRTLTMWQAAMRQLSIQFAKGDRHARRDVFWIAERLGTTFLTPTKAFNEIVGPDHQAILDSYVARRTTPTSAAAAPVVAPPELLDDDKEN